jgi:hypothetical protein
MSEPEHRHMKSETYLTNRRLEFVCLTFRGKNDFRAQYRIRDGEKK